MAGVYKQLDLNSRAPVVFDGIVRRRTWRTAWFTEHVAVFKLRSKTSNISDYWRTPYKVHYVPLNKVRMMTEEKLANLTWARHMVRRLLIQAQMAATQYLQCRI